MDYKELTVEKIGEIVKPILHKYNINKMGVFGAYALGLQSEISNVDLWVERGNVTNFKALMDIEKELKEALGRPVNLQFADADLSPYYLEDVTRTFVEIK